MTNASASARSDADGVRTLFRGADAAATPAGWDVLVDEDTPRFSRMADDPDPPRAEAAPPAHRWYKHLYVQVLAAILAGILLGHFHPTLGAQMKPLGDGFIKLIKMLIAPIIFCTVVHGIASMEDMKKVGRVGIKALIYFEVMTTLALIIGLVVVNLWAPGTGMNVDAAALDTRGIATYTAKAGQQSTVEFLLHIIPNTVVGAFAEGEILQVLLIAILFAFALQSLGAHGRPVLHGIDMIAQVFFRIVGYVMKVAWLGAFGAMAFTIGRYGLSTLVQLGSLMAGFYATCRAAGLPESETGWPRLHPPRRMDWGGEMAALLQGEDREGDDAARSVAERYGAVVAVRGAVASPDGRLWHDEAGGVGLGTSGSGDVLAGVVGGLLARGADAEQAAVWGQYLHAAAGDRLAARVGRVGFLARELLDEVPMVLTGLRV